MDVLTVVPDDECYLLLHPDVRDHVIDFQGGPGSRTPATPPAEHTHLFSPPQTLYSAMAQVRYVPSRT